MPSMATTFANHLLTGDHASRPLADAVPQGTLYSCTDHALIYMSDGDAWSTWATLGGEAVVIPGSIVAIFDGGGDALVADSFVDIPMPDDGTITAWTLLADQSGDVELDIRVDSFANFPPTGADSIVAAAPPEITADTKATSSTLTAWDTSLTAGDIMRVVVVSATDITKVTLYLTVNRS